MSLQSSDVTNVLTQAEQTQNYPNQADGLHLDITQATQVSPQPASPGVLPSQQVVGQQVLRLRLDLLQPKQDKVRTETVQQGGEIEGVRELDGHIPGDQLQAEQKLPIYNKPTFLHN